MANQRIFIRCISCGKEKMLAKRSIDSFHTLHDPDMAKDWDDWFDAHRWGFCGDNARGLDIFELVYEDSQEMEMGFSG